MALRSTTLLILSSMGIVLTLAFSALADADIPLASAPLPLLSLLAEPAGLQVNQCAYAAQIADAATACSRTSVEDLIAWANGADENCIGTRSESFVKEMGDKLSARFVSRNASLLALSATTPEQRAAFIQALAPGYPAERGKTEFNRFLESLRLFVNAHKTMDARQAVLHYTYFQTGFYSLNRILREGGPAAQCLEPLRKALVAAFVSHEKFEGTVWRGLSLPADILSQYQLNTVFTWPAFSSTSIDRSVAATFSNTSNLIPVLFQIRSKNCIDARALSDKLPENEVLCLPGTVVRVTGRPDSNRVELEEI